MVKRNRNIEKVQPSYLFVDINQRKKRHIDANPDANLISLGIGDTVLPLFDELATDLSAYAKNLGTVAGYSGYPDWNGPAPLREAIANQFYKDCGITAEDIIVSDGSKPDLARMQLLFGDQTTVAVQNPVYPAYVDDSVISGKTGEFDPEKGQYKGIVYMPCTVGNNFFPDLNVERTDLIYFCSPNNPTGAVATRERLTELVNHALKNKSIVIFDSAYREFISDDNLPKSIYEIPGAEKCAIETSSFSKLVGFTGVRLGWTICPKGVTYDDGKSVFDDWKRVVGTTFNGPSILASAGGLAALAKPEGMKKQIAYYMENAATLRDVLEKKGIPCYGGENAPYIWCKIEGKTSWDLFDSLLSQNIVCTPGSGFGSCGEGFVRFSCFATHENVAKASKILEQWTP